MNARELLSDAWRDLTRHQACTGPAAQAVLAQLMQAYSEPHRHYHTFEHVAALLRLLEKYGGEVLDRNAVGLAILFHDVIYDPGRHDNEHASAEFAGERLAPLGFPDQLIAKVKRYIIATQHGQSAPTIIDPDLALLLDLDLSILAAAPAAYRAYAQAIRREYAHVPDVLYGLGRRCILEDFLARERIYGTNHLHVLWDQRARSNIAGEMAGLV